MSDSIAFPIYFFLSKIIGYKCIFQRSGKLPPILGNHFGGCIRDKRGSTEFDKRIKIEKA